MARRGENIRKRKDGRWEGRYICAKGDGSKAKTCSVYAKSYKDVRKKLEEARRKVELQEKTGAFGLLFSDIAGRWLDETFTAKKYSTYIKYRQIYKKYLADSLGGQMVEDITMEFLSEQVLPCAANSGGTGQISESLEKSIFCIVNQILKYASQKNLANLPPLTREPQRIIKKQISVFTISEQHKLVHFLHEDMDTYKLGVILCLHTGLRLGELCALKWSDVDLENRILYVSATVQRLPVLTPDPGGKKTMLVETPPKSLCSKREIPISDLLFQELLKFYKTSSYVVGGDKPTDPRTYQKKFSSYLKSAGIEYRSFHTLRHTFASGCAAQGVDAKALSEILGHANVQITLNRYVHPSMMVKRRYLNLLSVDISGQKMGQAV